MTRTRSRALGLPAALALIVAALAMALAAGKASAQSVATPTEPADGAAILDDSVVLRWALDPAGHSRRLEVSGRSETSFAGGPFLARADFSALDARDRAHLVGDLEPGWYYWHVSSELCASDEFWDCTGGDYGPTSSFAVLDTLGSGEAKAHFRDALLSHSNRYAKTYDVSCSSLDSLSAYCRGGAWIGDTSWFVKGKIFYSGDPDDNFRYYHYSLKGKRSDDYCLATRKRNRSKCVKKVRWAG
jgi:hypothetical protein